MARRHVCYDSCVEIYTAEASEENPDGLRWSELPECCSTDVFCANCDEHVLDHPSGPQGRKCIFNPMLFKRGYDWIVEITDGSHEFPSRPPTSGQMTPIDEARLVRILRPKQY